MKKSVLIKQTLSQRVERVRNTKKQMSLTTDDD